MFVKPVRYVIRYEWFGMAPKGAGLTMRDWLAIAKIVKRKKIRKCDWARVEGVINEYIYS
jgi:DNA polymerase elongation subunit (family B)